MTLDDKGIIEGGQVMTTVPTEIGGVMAKTRLRAALTETGAMADLGM